MLRPSPGCLRPAKPVVPCLLVWGTRPPCAARASGWAGGAARVLWAWKGGRAVSLGLGNATALRGAGIGMGRRCDEFDGPGARSSGSGVDWIYGNAGLVLAAALLCHLANSGTK